MSEQINSPTGPRIETCRCQHCDYRIEFDASGLAEGQTCKVTCPQCLSESEFIMPQSPPIPEPPTPARVIRQWKWKRLFPIVAIIVACVGIAAVLFGLLSFFRPKPITGQIFVVTQAGLNIPLGAVEVEIVGRKNADDFMRERRDEIEAKLNVLQKAYDVAKTNRDKAAEDQKQAQTAFQEAFDENAVAYTNDTRYASLRKERAKDIQAITALTNAITLQVRETLGNAYNSRVASVVRLTDCILYGGG